MDSTGSSLLSHVVPPSWLLYTSPEYEAQLMRDGAAGSMATCIIRPGGTSPRSRRSQLWPTSRLRNSAPSGTVSGGAAPPPAPDAR